MDAKRSELQGHEKHINSVLQDVCEASYPAPLVHLTDGTIALATTCPPTLRREVITDLGFREIALRLPIPDVTNPQFWIAMHEDWEWQNRHTARFLRCGLRLYFGERSEEAAQFLRLEWVAPTVNGGVPNYEGAHAGHPHWHVDSAALVGAEARFQSLELLKAPSPEAQREFSEDAFADAAAEPTHDFSWLQKFHLPARAQWMNVEWDGSKVPGPHQCEPHSLNELLCWWDGALRYLAAELST